MDEQLVQGHYAAASVRFEPATIRLQGTEHTPTPPRPIKCMHVRASCICLPMYFLGYLSFCLIVYLTGKENTSTISTLFSTQVNRYENCATVGAQQTDSTLIFQSSQCKSPRQFICQGK